MVHRGIRLGALIAIAVASSATAAIEGVVVSATGVPVEHARVDLIEPADSAYTDRSGRFTFPDADPPALLVISHPKFHAQSVDLGSGDVGSLEIALVAKQEIFEEIVVSANPGEGGFAPISVAASSVDPAEAPLPPGLPESDAPSSQKLRRRWSANGCVPVLDLDM